MTLVGSPYFLFLAIGFAFGFVWLIRNGERRGLERVVLIDVCIAALVGGILGGRLLHVLAEPLPAHSLSPHDVATLREQLPQLDPGLRGVLQPKLDTGEVPAVWFFLAEMPPGPLRERAIALAAESPDAVPARWWYWARPLRALQVWRGGLAYFGGLVVAFGLGLIVVWRHEAPLREFLDLAAPAIVLGLIFGRIGCFLGGCCYGQTCDPAWWSMPPPWYEGYGPPVAGAARYPTALLSAAFAAGLFAFLRWLGPRRAFVGEVFLAMLAVYAPGRFGIEALRDDPRGGWAGLSTTQWAVLVTGLPAGALWLWLRRRGRLAPSIE